MKLNHFLLLLLCLVCACGTPKNDDAESKQTQTTTSKTTQKETSESPLTAVSAPSAKTEDEDNPPKNTTPETAPLLSAEQIAALPDTALVDVLQMDTTFVLDIKYATSDNFTKQILYPCARCLLRKEAALALVQAHKSLKAQGFYLILFDCYRPHAVQQKMWAVYPDRRYVADPKKGSTHNRGTAIDVSLANHAKQAIDMGSPYDFFGKISHFAYKDLPDSTLFLRKFLRKELEKVGFRGITTEWWHFSHRKQKHRILNEDLCEVL